MDSSQPHQSPFLFDALDQEGERIQGPLQGKDEDEVRTKLQNEFGYKVVNIRIPIQQEPLPEEMKKEDNILFEGKPKPKTVVKKIPQEKLSMLHHRVQTMLHENNAFLSENTKACLRYLDGKIDLLKSYASKAQWWSLRWQLWRTLKRAQREIALYHKKKWMEYETKETPSQSYTEFGDAVKKKRMWNQPAFLNRMKHWLVILEHPDEANEEEMLVKQQYESVWLELQRFSTALLVFYLLFLGIAYYLKRNLGPDLFLVRIYDALLFQQLILGLFSFSAIVTLRRFFLPKRVILDGILIITFGVILWFVF